MQYELHKAVCLVFFDDACQIKTPQESFTIAGGAAVMRVVEGLKGRRKQDILQKLSGNMHSETRAAEFVGFLEKHDVLVDAANNQFCTQYEAVLDFKNRRAKKLTGDASPLESLSSISDVFLDGNDALVQAFKPMLDTLGLKQEDEARAGLSCFLNYQASTDMLLRQNSEAYARKRPYLICNFSAKEFVFGPVVVPQLATSCYHCLFQRSYANANYKREFLASRHLSSLVHDVPSDLAALYVGLLANEIRKLRQLDTAASLIDQLLVIDISDMSVEKRAIIKAPRCEVCAKQNHRPLSAIRNMM